MKSLLLTFLGCGLILSGCQKPQDQHAETSEEVVALEQEEDAQHNQLTTSEQEAGWKLLFDGQNPDQWRGYQNETFPENGWDVRDGELVVLKTPEGGSGGGDIITRESYENFELSLEFVISDSANSGIFYLAQEQEDTPIWHSAPEYQILDNQLYLNWTDLDMDMHTHLTAENYDLQAAEEDHSKPVGEWNHAKIVVNQGHVEHWINGYKAIEYDINSDTWKQQVAASKFKDYPQYGQAVQGHIGLQDHGHQVRFRNIKIKTL
ncbi:MAG: DUF1080 domain-containing protein [Cyclobacteriaceae bacterium]|nr:DUF1080 domain-containing protein [Cyclobacteriaceae bacterium]